MKKVAILGSTGSIGIQTLDVIRNHDDLKLAAVSAGSNIDLLEEQIREFHPRIAAVWSESKAKELRASIADVVPACKVVSGMDGLLEMAAMEESDILVTAVVGMIGIKPTIAAIHAGKDIALANKETLVTAGHIIIPLAAEKKVSILPVDSEHSAIFQCLNGEHSNQIHKILLTASGGPFRGKTMKDLETVTLEMALQHPNWSMGKKITIDSATMVNKGLEVIEAKWLFGIEPSQIEVVVQPQSIIHSMVEFEDGAVMAQLGTPDMRLPIQYALYYPNRVFLDGTRLDFSKLSEITFQKPDLDTFLGLKYAYEAIETGGSMPTVLNAANELAVAKFLHKKVRFLEIYEMIRLCMDRHTLIENPTVEEILETEKWVYETIESRWIS
ncbi:MAG: 1-deoxy-D-xylulose-5-phosphate reductoisomerase [Lachnospiraceae bacterium]|nr:1-deoxy-D-xylulose-5-phosphate reductoisomerase [Lachnospiraceae bacterium]MDE6759489.1 1-deoxy-D-xylulose-5-phosphate reductoisomerase [Lachnospiraceae bacterium]